VTDLNREAGELGEFGAGANENEAAAREGDAEAPEGETWPVLDLPEG